MNGASAAVQIPSLKAGDITMQRQNKTKLMKLAAQADPRTSHGFNAAMGDPYPMPSVHAHGDLEVNYIFSGSTRYFLAGRFVDLPEHSFSAFWAAMPHQVVACSESSQYMWLSVPLATLLRWNLGHAFLRRVLGGEVLLEATGPTWDAELTRRWIDDLHSNEPLRLRTVELEVEARLRRLLLSSHDTEGRVLGRKAQDQVEAIASYLNSHYQQHLSIADIGEAIHLHPNYAMSLFRRECGLTIWQYLMRLRLAQAQALLLTSDMPVLAVALESGFGSLPRFYAAFSRECGMSPGDYRHRA
jgi:AraC-like DNA-binding protein